MLKNECILREWRLKNNWTLQDVADELNAMKFVKGKITKSVVSDWERGAHVPSNAVIQALTKLTVIEPEKLLENFKSLKKQNMEGK